MLIKVWRRRTYRWDTADLQMAYKMNFFGGEEMGCGRKSAAPPRMGRKGRGGGRTFGAGQRAGRDFFTLSASLSHQSISLSRKSLLASFRWLLA